jgi:hypothetical protein
MVKGTEAVKHLEDITRGLMGDFINDYIKVDPKEK